MCGHSGPGAVSACGTCAGTAGRVLLVPLFQTVTVNGALLCLSPKTDLRTCIQRAQVSLRRHECWRRVHGASFVTGLLSEQRQIFGDRDVRIL